MRSLLVLALLAPVALPAKRLVVEVRLQRVESARLRPRLLFPRSRFSLVARRLKAFDALPTVSKAGRYALARLGGRKIPLAFDAPEGAPAIGVLHGGGAPAKGRARSLGQEGFAVEFVAADCGGMPCNVRITYRGMQPRGGTIETTYHMRGKAVLNGAVREVVLIDADADGRYDGKADRWIAPLAAKAAKLKTLALPASLRHNEPQIPFEQDGRALGVEHVAADGTRLTLVLDKPKMTMHQVLDRRYAEVRAGHFETFEGEMAGFVAAQKMDLHRERTDRTAPWSSMPLSQAREIAKESDKPLLVAFYTEGNPWCYRYEFYTFQDAEVDRLLRRFVLVRVDAEKDPEKNYGKYAPRGLPALMPLTADGQAVRFHLRSRDAELVKAESMIIGWQRPTELAVNLKRILKACSER